MKYIIAGGRDFNNRNILYAIMNTVKKYGPSVNKPITEIITGDARGADTLGAEWANVNGIRLTHFPAKWEMYGKSAGFIRNVDMGEYADAAIIFWNGESKGTKHMIQTMKKLGKPYSVFNYKGELIESNGI